MMEESKSTGPPRCPCGFWGSSSTLGMCSKCYKAHLEKKQDALQSTSDHMIRKPDSGKPMMTSGSCGMDGAPQASSSRDGASLTSLRSNDSTRLTVTVTGEKLSSGGAQGDQRSTPHIPLSTSMHIDTSSLESQKTCLGAVVNSELQTTCLTANSSNNSKKQEENNANENGLTNEPGSSKSSDIKDTEEKSACSSTNNTPEKDSRGVKRDVSTLEADSTPESTPEKGKQKNKKRCNQCNAKLELAQRQIGRCRCDLVFCALHRLPELHNCDFDHKEDGRREARQKMVKPTRHLGNAFRRLNSDS